MRLVGRFVDIMCEVNPEYKQYVRYERGIKVLYLRVLRAIYGCLESALLWYNLYSTTLVKLGFELNPYDLCVANKIIDGTQCTIAFYGDDNKLSHKDPAVVRKVIKDIEKHFGKMTVEEGTHFNFLGMNIKMRTDKKIEIEMKNQIREAINWFGEEINEKPSTPANKNLFGTSKDSKELDEKKSELFHSIVAKLLYICKRARPDVETAVSYLCTRVSKSTDNDWKKLRRVLGFLQKTIDDVRIIGADNLQSLFTWIDAAYGVHEDDMKSHTGGIMSMGTGAIHQRSTKQKLNVKSSTEAEVVGTSDYAPYNIWMRNFLAVQGYKLQDNILFQDNQSAIKMEVNGRRSCTGNSRHVHIRHFFVKDLIDKKLIRVLYCPTNKMLADFFTKPLQGELFRFFRNIIMGYTSIMEILDDHTEIKERVEKWKNYGYKMISSIDRRTDLNTVCTIAESKSNESDNILTDSKAVSSTKHREPYVQGTKNNNGTYTYADIAKRAIK